MKSESSFFSPKLFTTLGNYSWEQFGTDGIAGIIVGIVALPLAIAFAIASGVTPERGIVTAVIAGFIISVLGGSKVQIGGPTGAYVVIVYKIVQTYGVDGLIACSLLAGVLLILMGVFRLGTAIKFIPYPLTVGFTSGIAAVIFSSQVKDFLGLSVEKVPADFIDKWAVYFENFSTMDPLTIALAALALGIIILWPKVNRRIPGPIIAIIAVTAIAQYWNLPVETIGSRFGAMPTGLPHPALPSISLAHLRELAAPAFTIAILGAIESLLSATVADGMIQGRHRSNTELIAQGVANIITPLFGGIPATGAIARTVTNVKNGGRTPVAGIVHSITLLLILLIFGKWAEYIPLCVLAAILIVVSYHMSEWRAFRALLKSPRSDVAVLVATFLLTVFIDLTVAVEIGMLLSLALFVRRMTDVTAIRELRHDIKEENDSEDVERTHLRIPPGVVVYQAEGVFFFGVADVLRKTFSLGANAPRAIVLDMSHVLALDATGLRALDDLHTACAASGGALILSGLKSQPLTALNKAGLRYKIGSDHIFTDGLRLAITHAGKIAERTQKI